MLLFQEELRVTSRQRLSLVPLGYPISWASPCFILSATFNILVAQAPSTQQLSNVQQMHPSPHSFAPSFRNKDKKGPKIKDGCGRSLSLTELTLQLRSQRNTQTTVTQYRKYEERKRSVCPIGTTMTPLGPGSGWHSPHWNEGKMWSSLLCSSSQWWRVGSSLTTESAQQMIYQGEVTSWLIFVVFQKI